MKIEDALAQFEVQLAANGRSEHTVKQYRRHVRALARWAADARLSGHIEDLDHQAIARFLASPAARTRPDGGVKRAISVNALRTSLRCFFGYLHSAGCVPLNPARLVRPARCAPPPPQAMDEGDLRRLLDTLAAAQGPEAARDHALIRLLAASGVRLGSAVALDVEDVDLDRGEVTLRVTKGDRPDRVPLPADVCDHLRHWLAGRASGPLFLARERRVSGRHVQRLFAAWLRRAGITRAATVHSLRHAFAVRIYHQTHDILVVGRALRHRSLQSTIRYTTADDGRVRAWIESSSPRLAAKT